MVAAEPKVNMSLLDSVEIGICALTTYSITQQFFTKVWINEAVEAKIMLDSGSAGNFISPSAIERYRLKTQPRETPLSVTHIQGGTVGTVTEQVRCNMRHGDHTEEITLDVVPLGKHAIILGMLWLTVHDPQVSWGNRRVTFSSEYCKENCLPRLQETEEDIEELEIMELAVVSEEERGTIPEEYHDLLEVFDIEKARTMPQSRGQFDFKIEFIPKAEWPKPSKPYRLTPAQMDEAKAQIKELEDGGMISKSDSPFVAPLFFVPKKDGGQRMCIDYRKLNSITIRDAYPLPNMETLLESA
jgi:hypothetical protein